MGSKTSENCPIVLTLCLPASKRAQLKAIEKPPFAPANPQEIATRDIGGFGGIENSSWKSFSVDVDMRRVAVCSMTPAALVRASSLFTIALEKQSALVLVPPFLTMRCGNGKGSRAGCAVF
jgi:hypothetical protein